MLTIAQRARHFDAAQGTQPAARGTVDTGGPPPSDVVVDDTMSGSNVVAGAPTVGGAVDCTAADDVGRSERITVAWSSSWPATSVMQTATISIVAIITASRRCADVNGSPLRHQSASSRSDLDAIGVNFLPHLFVGDAVALVGLSPISTRPRP
jgi:hypothetical protein